MAWPTTKNPRTAFVTLRMTTEEAASLDKVIQANPDRYASRSDFVRTAVAVALARHNLARLDGDESDGLEALDD